MSTHLSCRLVQPFVNTPHTNQLPSGYVQINHCTRIKGAISAAIIIIVRMNNVVVVLAVIITIIICITPPPFPGITYVLVILLSSSSPSSIIFVVMTPLLFFLFLSLLFFLCLFVRVFNTDVRCLTYVVIVLWHTYTTTFRRMLFYYLRRWATELEKNLDEGLLS